MNNFETGALAPEFFAPENQLIVPKSAGLLAIRGAIDETFRMADSYVRTNTDLIGYDYIWDRPGIRHYYPSTDDFTSFEVYEDADKVHTVRVAFDRGTKTYGGNTKIDMCKLTRLSGTDAVLTHQVATESGPSRYHPVELVVKDYDTGELEFGRGIGPRRQDRAAKFLLVMQDRIRRLSGED